MINLMIPVLQKQYIPILNLNESIFFKQLIYLLNCVSTLSQKYD